MRRAWLATMLIGALLGSAVVSGAEAAEPDLRTFRFGGTSVSVVNHSDTIFESEGIFDTADEPFLYNLWFRVKVGKPGSARVGVAGDRTHAVASLSDGQSKTLEGPQRSEVLFDNVEMVDFADLLTAGKHLEIVGSWSWAMERDNVDKREAVEFVQEYVQGVLNDIVASATIPTDAQFLVDMLLEDLPRVFRVAGEAVASLVPPIINLTDKAMGSRLYVGIGAKGHLSDLIEPGNDTIHLPRIDIPLVTFPPDIAGGEIFSLSRDRSFANQWMDGNGRHDYEIEIADVENVKPPTAHASVSVATGAAPLMVTFDATGSSDPDGQIVAHNWDFGDFTTGAGETVSRWFNKPGVYDVTLEVTDDDELTVATTVTVTVTGQPPPPSGIKYVGSGCCDTYVDVSWNMVPTAEAYEIFVDGNFGGGCVTDHGAVIEGQVSTGRVRAVGLCLGSTYDIRMRTRIDGAWGPWSPDSRVTI